jgi:hypothetical protein
MEVRGHPYKRWLCWISQRFLRRKQNRLPIHYPKGYMVSLDAALVRFLRQRDGMGESGVRIERNGGQVQVIEQPQSHLTSSLIGVEI